MNWVLPTPLLLFAGVVALMPLAALVRRPTSAPRLVAEVALWLIEQRW
jgi:H+/gluconate symporter-like permease